MSCMAISDTHSVNNKNKVIKVLIQSLTENYENLVLNFCGEVGDSKENVRRNLTKRQIHGMSTKRKYCSLKMFSFCFDEVCEFLYAPVEHLSLNSKNAGAEEVFKNKQHCKISNSNLT